MYVGESHVRIFINLLQKLYTIGGEAVFGLIEATSVCIKMNVRKTVSAMLSLPSLLNGMNTEAIPVRVTSSIGKSKLKIFYVNNKALSHWQFS